MPHVERDTESEPKRTLYEDDASLMQAWSEEGTALVRPWYGDDMSRPEIGLHSMCLVLLVSEEPAPALPDDTNLMCLVLVLS